jgi:Peptidase family M28
MRAVGNRGLILALIGIALVLAATLAAYWPATPLGPDASGRRFSAYRAKSILQDLTGSGIPHPIGSRADAQVRANIVKRLSAMGYAPELQSGFVCNDEGVCGSPVNIIVQLAGSTEDHGAVLLAAHYDSVPAGPGASDDGAGVATVLEIAHILKAPPAPHRRIVLLLTDGEEAGLLGASLFVRDPLLSKQVLAAVNLEARGTSGPSLMFETGTANRWLMHLYGSNIARPVANSLYYMVYKHLPEDTDFTVFKTAAYQGFNFAYIGDVGRYHTPLDSAGNADVGSIQQQGDNALAAVSALANAPDLHPPTAESVFFDGFSRTLIAWPVEFTLPVALLFLTLLLAETVILLRTGTVNGRQVMWGWIGTLCALIAGVALCAGLLALLIAAGKVPPMDGASWISRPLPMQLVAAAIAALAVGGTSAWLWRRVGFWGFWVTAALLVAALSVATAVAIPGASFVPLLAAIAAGVGALPICVNLVRSRKPAPWAADFAALLPALVIFAGLLPLLEFLYIALGSLAWPISTLVLTLGSSTLLPLLAAASGRARRSVITIAAVIAVGGLAVTLYLPTYSADWPERINVEYWLDADTGQSHYLVRCDSLRLPPAIAAAAHFDPIPRPRFPGSAALGFYAAAPRLALAAPELALISRRTSPSSPSPASPVSPAVSTGTEFDLRLRSTRGAPQALVVFPASAQVRDITVTTAQGPLRTKLRTLSSGATLLEFVTLPAEGVAFAVKVAGSVPVAVQVFDASYGLEAGKSLAEARPQNAASSQEGDLTVVHRTVSLDPAADR